MVYKDRPESFYRGQIKFSQTSLEIPKPAWTGWGQAKEARDSQSFTTVKINLWNLEAAEQH